MSRWGRGTAAFLILLTVLLGLPPAAVAAGNDRPVVRVLVIGVPGLTWTDVDRTGTPELWAMAGQSAIGAVSVRAARSTTCLLDGWATLGAGNRARVPGPDETQPDPPADPTLSHCERQEQAALADPATAVARTAQDAGTARFGAQPGALGRAVGCATVSGAAATLAAAAPGVPLTRADTLPADPAGLAGLLTGCPLTLISLDQLTTARTPGGARTDLGTEPAARAAALRGIDAAVGRLRAAVASLDGDTLVLLAGISEVNNGRAQLHVGMASGPGFDTSGRLTSASTGRAPFVQLIDLAPTALNALGLAQPPSMNGQAMRAEGTRPELAQAVTELGQGNTAATVHHRSTGVFFWTLVLLSSAVVLLGMLVLGSVPGRPAPAGGSSGRRLLRVAAVVAAALPIATYLAGLVPWERAGAPMPALVGALVAADVVVAAIALGGPWRRHRLGPALAVLGVTLGTLLADVLTGSTLELNGLLGYDAIVAGRFTGYGNLTFGLLSVSALGVVAGLATLAGRRAGPARARLTTGGTVLVLGLLVVGVIGAPDLGRDFGGVLAALPGFLVLAMLLARVRVTVVRLLAVLAAAVVVVGTIAVLDWLRPGADRSHLGRFVEQILTGEAWTVISRKGQATLDILLGSPLAWMLPVALVAAVWLVRPGGLLRSRRGDDVGGRAGLSAEQVFVVRSVLLSALLSLVLGAAVNDSGVAVPATAAALLVPLMVWLAAGAPDPGETAGAVPRSGPGEGSDRVTVVSRGSTVWNT